VTSISPSNGRFLRVNVGFILKQGAGYSRQITFDQPGAVRAEDILISGLAGGLRLSRTPQGVLTQGTLQASMSLECVRCLTPFEHPYSIEISELFIPEELSHTREVDVPPSNIVDEGGFIDLTPIVREESILAVPIRALCSADCRGLCSECGQNLNEGACACEHEHIDPRLASLRALLEEFEE
jgi:uncharacterized protein